MAARIALGFVLAALATAGSAARAAPTGSPAAAIAGRYMHGY